MICNSFTRVPQFCFYADCPSRKSSPKFSYLVRKGFFFRSSDSRHIARFHCKSCNRSFSLARNSPCFLQKRRRLNDPIRKHLAQGMTQRQIARVLKTTRSTVARKFDFLATQARLSHKEFLARLKAQNRPLSLLYFDEMESFEHSKCLPISIPIVVDPLTRKIIGIGACSMPAKGLLARVSVKRYGPRADHRPACAKELFESISHVLAEGVCVVSDQNPMYPQWLKSLPGVTQHRTHKGRRPCVVGQGELKAGDFDPLFALNHTCAMVRAHVSRMFRRTWNTTKRVKRLEDHLYIYAQYHNQVLTAT